MPRIIRRFYDPGDAAVVRNCFAMPSGFHLRMSHSVELKIVEAPKLQKEQRYSARIETPYPVRLRGIDTQGRLFKEETFVENLSVGGVYLRIKRKVQEGVGVCVAVRLSTDIETPALRLAARGTILRVEWQPNGDYGVAIEFSRRRVL